MNPNWYLPTIKILLFDFSRVLLFPKDRDHSGGLNPLHRKLLSEDSSYDFLNHFFLNHELLDFLNTSPRQRYIFTSGQIQKAPVIQDDINGVFEMVFSAEDLDISKQDADSYLLICEKIGAKPSETLFIDDSIKNIKPAKRAGLQTHHFIDNQSLIAHLN